MGTGEPSSVPFPTLCQANHAADRGFDQVRSDHGVTLAADRGIDGQPAVLSGCIRPPADQRGMAQNSCAVRRRTWWRDFHAPVERARRGPNLPPPALIVGTSTRRLGRLAKVRENWTRPQVDTNDTKQGPRSDRFPIGKPRSESPSPPTTSSATRPAESRTSAHELTARRRTPGSRGPA